MRWIEANIGLKNDVLFMNSVLIDFVKPLVDSNREKLTSWHFLWQPKPWPKLKGTGITLRLRFYGEDETVKQLRCSVDTKLTNLEKQKPGFYLGHCFGKHGECGQEYDGEADNKWGSDGWELGIRMLELGSETALKLIENKDRLGNSSAYRGDIWFYADRYVHLFLNQLTTMVDEVEFYLGEICCRRRGNKHGA